MISIAAAYDSEPQRFWPARNPRPQCDFSDFAHKLIRVVTGYVSVQRTYWHDWLLLFRATVRRTCALGIIMMRMLILVKS